MGIMEEIGSLNILYFLIPIIAFLIWYFKKKKKRVGMVEEKKETIYEPQIEVMKPEKKEMPPEPPRPREIVMEETDWKRVVIFIGVLGFLIFSIAFSWGVINNKFASSSNVVCSECPECNCNPAPCICNMTCEKTECPPCICNVTTNPIINVYYNITYNQTNSTV